MKKINSIFLVTVVMLLLSSCKNSIDDYNFDNIRGCVISMNVGTSDENCSDADASLVMTDYAEHLKIYFNDDSITFDGQISIHNGNMRFTVAFFNLGSDIITLHEDFSKMNEQVNKDIEKIVDDLSIENYTITTYFAEKALGVTGVSVSYYKGSEINELSVKVPEKIDIEDNLEHDLKDFKKLFDDNFNTARLNIMNDIGEIQLNINSYDMTYYMSIITKDDSFNLESKTAEGYMESIFPGYDQR